MGSEITAESREIPRGGGRRGVRLLPDELVDQIAAGEVVERPASVVKELVENALDAGARRVAVEVRDGGIAWIAVTDDGSGMSPRDARLALQRHATSKLGSVADLERITSFGFRGEALPAIASVSRLRLVTRRADDAEGLEIRVEGGSRVAERATGCPAGTRIEVADLFASVPARRKFLKKPPTEWRHISDWLSRLALALPGVHFELRRDERAPIVWPATADPRDRIAAVLSADEADGLVQVEHEEPFGHVQAFLSSPERTRPNASGLFQFVNGRPVRDRLLQHALLDVYRDLLPRGRFPSGVVFLTVPPAQVDVNVHPAKWEVRFADPRAIHQLVRRTAREAIAGREWLAGPGVVAESAPRAGWGATTTMAGQGGGAPRAEPGATSDWIFATHSEQAAGGDAGQGAAVDDPHRADTRGAVDPQRLHFRELRLVGQLLASYLVVERKDGLVLIDQHAAHERVLYERLRAEWLERGVARQGLLSPLSVELEPAAVAACCDGRELALRLGFELEPFGEEAVVVRSVPALLSGMNPVAMVRSLAHELLERGDASDGGADDTRLLESADRAFATLACHSARRAGDHLEPAEQRAILEALDTIPWAPTCPHGRPVAVALPLSEIERRFRR